MNKDETNRKPCIFQLNDVDEKFEEIELNQDTPLHKLLDSEFVILFLSQKFCFQ